jgi:hypothetical protein
MPRFPVAGPVVIPSGIEVKLEWVNGSRSFRNVLHGTYAGTRPVPPTLAETVFSAIKASASTTAWLAHLPAEVEFVGVSLKDLNTQHQVDNPSTSGAALGTAAGLASPLNTALVVTLTTAQSGAGFRGRVYLAGMVNEDQQSSTLWSAAVGAAAVAFIQGVQAVMLANGMPMAVGQHALNAGTHHDGSPWEARPAAVVPVTGISIRNPRIDTQRRRLGR